MLAGGSGSCRHHDELWAEDPSRINFRLVGRNVLLLRRLNGCLGGANNSEGRVDRKVGRSTGRYLCCLLFRSVKYACLYGKSNPKGRSYSKRTYAYVAGCLEGVGKLGCCLSLSCVYKWTKRTG